MTVCWLKKEKERTCAILKTSSSTMHIVPIGEGKSACHPLLEGKANRDDYRRAGQYSVSSYQ